MSWISVWERLGGWVLLKCGLIKSRDRPAASYVSPDAKLVALIVVSIHLAAGAARGLDIDPRCDSENG
jgi:hypothetical protein